MMTKSHSKFKANETVSWKWGNGTAKGTVKKIYTEKVTHTINGKEITRNATPEEPAYLISQADGQALLKSESELHTAP